MLKAALRYYPFWKLFSIIHINKPFEPSFTLQSPKIYPWENASLSEYPIALVWQRPLIQTGGDAFMPRVCFEVNRRRRRRSPVQLAVGIRLWSPTLSRPEINHRLQKWKQRLENSPPPKNTQWFCFVLFFFRGDVWDPNESEGCGNKQMTRLCRLLVTVHSAGGCRKATPKHLSTAFIVTVVERYSRVVLCTRQVNYALL